MPAKTAILRETRFPDFAALYRFLRSPVMRPLLASGQAETIADVIDDMLPAVVELYQRTPKGTTYLYVDDMPLGTVDHGGRYRPLAGSAAPGEPLRARDLLRRRGA